MLTGIKALIKKEDKFLLLHKSATVPRFPNYWDFPGGALESGEDPVEGIIREIKEETNLDVEGIERIWSTNLEVNGSLVEYILFEIKDFSGEIKLSLEHTEFKWVTKEELMTLKIQPYIEEYFLGQKT